MKNKYLETLIICILTLLMSFSLPSVPLFTDPENGDYSLSWNDTTRSPCIDAGDPDTTGLNLPPYDLAGNPRISGGIIDMGAYEYQQDTTGVDEQKFYKNLYVFTNSPNPFKSSTTITFISSDYERIKDYTLSIYNIKGQLIKRFTGKKDNFWVKTDIVWDGKDEQGKAVPSGVYFYRLSYGKHFVTKRMLLMR